MTLNLPALARSIWKPWLAVVFFALLAGWSTYRDSPQGLLRFTGDSPCPTVEHSFTHLMVLLFFVAAAVALVVAASAYIASELRLMASARDSLRQVALAAVALSLLLGVTTVIKWPLEALLPLKNVAACATPPANPTGANKATGH
jgi:hypothetical protein